MGQTGQTGQTGQAPEASQSAQDGTPLGGDAPNGPSSGPSQGAPGGSSDDGCSIGHGARHEGSGLGALGLVATMLALRRRRSSHAHAGVAYCDRD